jgi:hypothetical protein
MRPAASHALAASVAALVGIGAGWSMRAAPGPFAPAPTAPTASVSDATDAIASRDRARSDGGATGDGAIGPVRTPSVVGGATDRAQDAGTARRTPAIAPTERDQLAACTVERARLASEIAAQRADEREERGEPIAVPDALPPRFRADGVRSAVSRALEEARAGGRIEEVDCSEYPCIAFGRLRGDEEDMERVERAQALAPYRDDVLTMLFWAQSDDSAPRDQPRETGLFALAFYTAAERASHGEAIDRRVRIRTAELWNTVRPGW